MKLSREDREVITDIISAWTIVSVLKGGKEIWNCTGKETKESRNGKIEGRIKHIYAEQIIKEILFYFVRKAD